MGISHDRRVAFLVVCSVFCCTASAVNASFSGVYLHPGEFVGNDMSPEQREAAMDHALDAIRDCGFTTLIPYANTTSGSVYWPNAPLPEAGGAGYDALGRLTRKARERGLKVMPVICVLASGHHTPAGALHECPDWALRDADGERLGWVSPANPAARAWLRDLVVGMAQHVQPDGLMLDYMRYPNDRSIQLDGEGSRIFLAETPQDESDGERDTRMQRFKEDALSRLMEDIATALREEHPGMPIGLYTWGPHVPFDHPVAQSWPNWIRDGFLDMINVSGYCYRDNYGDAYLDVFSKRLRDAGDLALRAGATPDALTFALGVRTSHGAIPNVREMERYLAAARRAGFPGVAAFAWRGLEPLAEQTVASGYFASTQPLAAAENSTLTVEMEVDFGRDTGQHFGSLFEIVDKSGRVIAGAGFQGAYNTYYRADRFVLHTFVRPPEGDDTLERAPFPRPTDSLQHYLFDADGALFASDRNAQHLARRFQPDTSEWVEDGPPVFQLGATQLRLERNRIIANDRAVFEFDPEKGATGNYYYGGGALFFHLAVANSPDRATRLYACPWNPEQSPSVDLNRAIVLPLTTPGEFPYAYGQMRGDVLAATNTGGLYRFREGSWNTLREPDVTVSHQIYTMLNYYDRLLMGHYPTGELFELAGEDIRRIENWPPRPENASPRAREAQALAVYRGELFAGLWPWGELWRLPAPDAHWRYEGRLFSHPDIDPGITAPYEVEMNALGEQVYNLWGQRLTSLVSHGDSLYGSTANKNGALYEERLHFLANENHLEYGAIHRCTLPGAVAAPIQWRTGPTRFSITYSSDMMHIYQDDELLASTPLSFAVTPGAIPTTIRWGQGVYGLFGGCILERQTE